MRSTSEAGKSSVAPVAVPLTNAIVSPSAEAPPKYEVVAPSPYTHRSETNFTPH